MLYYNIIKLLCLPLFVIMSHFLLTFTTQKGYHNKKVFYQGALFSHEFYVKLRSIFMKTIEIISGEQKARFTTKSVTFDGKEYLYIKMSDVTHNTEECVYTFTYENEIKTLPYEAKDARILNAIFSQVQNLQVKKKHISEVSKTTEKSKVENHGISSEPDSEKELLYPEHSEKPDISSEKDAPLDPKAEKKAEKARLKAEKKAEKEKEKERKKIEKSKTENPDIITKENQQSGDNTATDENKEEPSDKFSLFEDLDQNSDKLSENIDNADSENSDPNVAEKKTRFKKSIIIFAIIVAVIVALSLIYFLIFGTKDKPSSINPSSTNSETYENIDELIYDLQ